MAGHQGVFQHYLVQLIRIKLLVLEHVHKAETEAATPPGVEGGHHEGIFPVGIIALRALPCAVLQQHAAGQLQHPYGIPVGIRVVFPEPTFDKHYAVLVGYGQQAVPDGF